MGKKVNDLVEKYRDKLPAGFLAEFEATTNVLSSDIANLQKGDKVNIIASEYSGRPGVVVGHNTKYGQPFVNVRFALKGDNYTGQFKEKLFAGSSLVAIKPRE